MTFAAPQLLWLALLAPAVAVIAAVLWRRRLQATHAWAARGLWSRLLPELSRGRLRLSLTLLAVAVLGAALGLAGPRWGEGQELVERRGVDVVFVLDSSLSMGAADVTPSRMTAAKTVIRRLLVEAPQHRVALVQAEGVGEVITPLTTDGAAVDLLLGHVEAGSLTTPGTDLVAALETGLDLFVEGDGKHRVMILLSDGEHHGGDLDATLERLAERGVVVHVLGFGTLQGAPVPIPGGSRAEVKRDGEGQVVVSRLGEGVLEAVARATGGLYRRVTTAGIPLAELVDRLDRMEAGTLAEETVVTHKERFQWPLAVAALALLLYLALGAFKPSTAPTAARVRS